MPDYYDGTKLLSLKDINGKDPEIFICTGNRTGGKTTYWNRWAFNKYLEGKGKFCLIYRFGNELKSVADKYFKDINTLFFPDYTVTAESRSDGQFMELYCSNVRDGENVMPRPIGYAISLNNADAVKKNSHLFSDVNRMIFDEFQTESNHYCSDEISKFQSVHVSIARGQGKQVRYVPVIMISNTVSIINPYYTAMGISQRLKADTKFLKGDGFVLEQGYVESAALAQKESGFNRAFTNSTYGLYAAENVYLRDSVAFIEKPKGKSRYLATVKYKNVEYAIREFADSGIIYCDDKPDVTYKYKLCITTEDHDINYVMLKRNEMFVVNMRYFFIRGCFRFKDLMCKEVIMKMLSY